MTRTPLGCLNILNGKGEVLGNLLATSGGSIMRVDETFWETLPPGAICARKLRFRAGYIPDLPFLTEQRELSPGKYYLQAVYYLNFRNY